MGHLFWQESRCRASRSPGHLQRQGQGRWGWFTLQFTFPSLCGSAVLFYCWQLESCSARLGLSGQSYSESRTLAVGGSLPVPVALFWLLCPGPPLPPPHQADLLWVFPSATSGLCLQPASRGSEKDFKRRQQQEASFCFLHTSLTLTHLLLASSFSLPSVTTTRYASAPGVMMAGDVRGWVTK